MGCSGFSDDAGVTNEFVEYAIQHHRAELQKILEADDVNGHYSVVINFVNLFETSMALGDGILSQPVNYLPLCDKALIDAQHDIIRAALQNNSLVVKINAHARISALPVCPELYKSVFPRNEDLGSFLRISGTVVRRTLPKMLEFKKTYLCNKCKHTFVLYAEYEKHYTLPPVGGCRNPMPCKSTNVVPVSSPDDFKDYQELKIQEQVGKLDMGSIPKSMLVTLEDDLVDACKPGDDVVICGAVRRRWKNLFNGSRPEVDLVLQANYLEVSNAQNNASMVTQDQVEDFKEFWKTHSNKPMIGRNFILQCVGPEVYGLYLIKLAIALVLSGGVAQHPGTGARVRGEAHLLLVGDPGTAKSQLLRFAAAVSPRSVFTTGIGSTSAGLTVSAALGAGGEWQLEAGALVLADGGICCIDEFNSIRESERASIHEAMEQQTLSVAKAGMVCKLSTVCSILAATNPKGQFDTAHPITVNCAIASPLLSRFDLVFVLLDRKNKDWDSLISSYIIQDKTLCKTNSSELWNVDKLQAYFSVVKSLQPQLTDEASLILKEYYRVQRRNEYSSASRITVRLLESLVRLAQGHAKLLFRNEVTVQDAVVSVSLMEASHQASSIDAFMSNPIQTTFPTDPEEEYIELAHKVLGNLGLQHLLDAEVEKYMNGGGNGGSSSTSETTPRPVPDFLAGQSQLLPPVKSDLSKKLDIVFNNIRQNKLREEQKAMVFQRKGANKKRKQRSNKVKKQASGENSDAGSLESDNSSCDDDKAAKQQVKKPKQSKFEPKRTKPVFVVNESDSEGDSMGEVNPATSTSVSICENEEADNACFHSSEPEESTKLQNKIINNGRQSNSQLFNRSKGNSTGGISKYDETAPSKMGRESKPSKTKSKLSTSVFAKSDSDSDLTGGSSPMKCTAPLSIFDNEGINNEDGSPSLYGSESIVKHDKSGRSNNVKHPSNSESISTPTLSVVNADSSTKKVKSVSSKTLNKLKSFAFKDSPSSKDHQPALNTSSSSLECQKSSEDHFNNSVSRVPSSPATSKTTNEPTPTVNTQSSIFCIGNDDHESDYEL